MGYWDDKPSWFKIDSADELRHALHDPESWGEWATGKIGYKVYLYSHASQPEVRLHKQAHAYPIELVAGYTSEEYQQLITDIEAFLFGGHNQKVWRERHQLHHLRLGLPPLDVGQGGLHGTGKL